MKNMKQTIRLTEEQLKQIIKDTINEAMTDESWFGNKVKQGKAAFATFKNNSGSLRDKFNTAKKNWSSQSELNDLGNLRQQLEDLIDKKGISPDTTIAELIGGKYRKGRRGTLSGMIDNRKGQITKRGGTFYEE